MCVKQAVGQLYGKQPTLSHSRGCGGLESSGPSFSLVVNGTDMISKLKINVVLTLGFQNRQTFRPTYLILVLGQNCESIQP